MTSGRKAPPIAALALVSQVVLATSVPAAAFLAPAVGLTSTPISQSAAVFQPSATRTHAAEA